MGTHPIFESDFDCLTEWVDLVATNLVAKTKWCSKLVWRSDPKTFKSLPRLRGRSTWARRRMWTTERASSRPKKLQKWCLASNSSSKRTKTGRSRPNVTYYTSDYLEEIITEIRADRNAEKTKTSTVKTADHQPEDALTVILLQAILLNGGELTKEELQRFLAEWGIKDGVKNECFKSVMTASAIVQSIMNKRYLQSEMVGNETTYTWGHRAKMEINPHSLIEYNAARINDSQSQEYTTVVERLTSRCHDQLKAIESYKKNQLKPHSNKIVEWETAIQKKADENRH